MADTLLFALPERPDCECRDTRWWHVVDGELVSAGQGDEWLNFADRRRNLIALAPVAQVRLNFSDKASSATTTRQAEAVARVAAINSSLGDDETLHAASAVADDGTIMTAVADRAAMSAWLEWTRTLGAEPHHVVPSGALLPLTDHWRALTLGEERIVGRRGAVLPNEPDLVGSIVGKGKIEVLNEEVARSALVNAAEASFIDLRTGPFARKPRIELKGRQVRELAVLAALIPLALLAWALVVIVKLERSTDRLDSETLAVASAALGRPVSLETAESELAQRVGGSAFGGLMAPLTAVYQALRSEQGVSATNLAYAPDGTLSVTFAAPTVDAVNRVLLSLQRNGYRVTAVPRQSSDGRSMVDVTVRTGP